MAAAIREPGMDPQQQACTRPLKTPAKRGVKIAITAQRWLKRGARYPYS
jgi:hypothetical protein